MSMMVQSGRFGGGGGGGDPHFASVVLLVGFDGSDGATTATDDSNSAHALTFIGNAQIDTSQAKFGTGSALFDGTGDNISIPHSNDFIFDEDFTVECFARWPALESKTEFVLSKSDSANSWEFLFDGSNPEFRASTNGTSRSELNSSAGGMVGPKDTWHHFAFDRSGSTIRMYINGVWRGSMTVAGALFNNSSTPLHIAGRSGQTGFMFDGWIDEIRITKGVARYASDAGLTVPTEAFPRS